MGIPQRGGCKHGFDLGQESLGLIRLRQVVVHTRLDPEDDVLWIRKRGEDNHRNVAQRLIVLDRATHGVPVHDRHDHVADDEVGAAFPDCLEGLCPIAGDAHPVAGPFQRVGELLCLCPAVLHDEDLEGFRCSLVRAHDAVPLLRSPVSARLTTAAAIASGVIVYCAPPNLTASPGIPNTTHDSRS